MKIFGSNKPQRMDAILGFHKLLKNGLAIDDYLSFNNTNFEDRKFSFIAGTSRHENNPNELRTWGSHKGKSIEMKIQYLDATLIKITYVQNMEGQGYREEGQPEMDVTINIPVNIILTKQ